MNQRYRERLLSSAACLGVSLPAEEKNKNLRVISISHSLPLRQELLWAELKIRLILYSIFHPDDPSLASRISTAVIHVSLAQFSQFSLTSPPRPRLGN